MGSGHPLAHVETSVIRIPKPIQKPLCRNEGRRSGQKKAGQKRPDGKTKPNSRFGRDEQPAKPITAKSGWVLSNVCGFSKLEQWFSWCARI